MKASSRAIDFKRQVLLFNPEGFKDKSVAIVGLGNIGSNVALALARLGIQNFTLYDPDVVEKHNLSSQAYHSGDVHEPKVTSMQGKMLEINSEIVAAPYVRKYEPRLTSRTPEMEIHADVVIIAVDSMKSRQKISEAYRTAHWPSLLIDARIGGNQLEVYNVRTWDEWQKTFSDKPDTDPCGGRYISYVSLMVGAIIANQVKKFFMNEVMDKNVVMDANTLQVIKDISWE